MGLAHVKLIWVLLTPGEMREPGRGKPSVLGQSQRQRPYSGVRMFTWFRRKAVLLYGITKHLLVTKTKDKGTDLGSTVLYSNIIIDRRSLVW
jgi:hypothetical protein